MDPLRAGLVLLLLFAAGQALASEETIAAGGESRSDLLYLPPGAARPRPLVGRGLEHVVVEGGGHSWPGGSPGWLLGRFLGPTTRALDANAELWRFFSARLSSP